MLIFFRILLDIVAFDSTNIARQMLLHNSKTWQLHVVLKGCNVLQLIQIEKRIQPKKELF